MTFGAGNLPLNPHRSTLFSESAQETCIKPGIEMEGIGHRRKLAVIAALDVGEAVRARRDNIVNVMLKWLGEPCGPPAQPVMMERQQPQRTANQPEAVHIGTVRPAPAFKGDAQFESAAGCGQEFSLINAKCIVEIADCRNGCFTNPDRTDFIGFNQRDRRSGMAEPGKCGCCHPACGAAADHDNLSLRVHSHTLAIPPGVRRHQLLV